MKRWVFVFVVSVFLSCVVVAQDANQLKISKAEEKVEKSQEKLKLAERSLVEADSLLALAEGVKKNYEDTLSQLADEDKALRRDYFNT